MAQVQFVDQATNVRITKTMPTPKQITRLDVWLRKACKIIPEIPNTENGGEWRVGFQEANGDWIRYDLLHRTGRRAYVVILRNLGKFGES